MENCSFAEAINQMAKNYDIESVDETTIIILLLISHMHSLWPRLHLLNNNANGKLHENSG